MSLLSLADLRNRPKSEWLVAEILQQNGLALLVGKSDSYKTFLALDFALCVATGTAWCGHETKWGPVVYVIAEGQKGFRERVDSWRQFHGVDFDPPLFTRDSRVGVESSSADVFELVAQIRELSAAPMLVVIDTLSRNINGDENSSRDMAAFVAGCDEIRTSTGAAVMIVHHEGHGENRRARGSSVLPAAADTILFATASGQRVTVECRKQKDSSQFPPMTLEAVKTCDSLAFRWVESVTHGLVGNRFLALDVLHSRSGLAGMSNTEWRSETGMGSSSFEIARKWLVSMNYASGGSKKPYAITAEGLAALKSCSTTPPALHSNSIEPKSTLLHRPLVYIDKGLEQDRGFEKRLRAKSSAETAAASQGARLHISPTV